jgi:hypothetical protein
MLQVPCRRTVRVNNDDEFTIDQDGDLKYEYDESLNNAIKRGQTGDLDGCSRCLTHVRCDTSL